MNPNAPANGARPIRVLPHLNSISDTLRKTAIIITEPLPRSQSELSGASSPSSSAFPKKMRSISSQLKSANASTSARSAAPSPSPSPSPPSAPKLPRTLMTLPDELQILVLSFMPLGDFTRLRRTSKYWRAFASPALLRSLHGGAAAFHTLLIQHCRVCMEHCPEGKSRTTTTRADAGFPLSSRCVKCAVQSRDGTLRIGHKVVLGNDKDCWTCRWCGWPVDELDAAAGHVQFHTRCYEKHALVLAAFFFLGWAQFTIGIVAGALAWNYFPQDPLVLGSTVAAFLLSWVCITLILFRGNKRRTYHWGLLVEVTIVGLWVSSGNRPNAMVSLLYACRLTRSRYQRYTESACSLPLLPWKYR